jgi:hypothetical protein
MGQPFSNPSRILRTLEVLLLFATAAFLALHFLHLTADFPNHSPWMDWSKYTDEGWYGDGAIRHFQRGHWYVPGDFNPAAALPTWPLLEALVFKFSGVSLAAARALTVTVFALILTTSYLLLRRNQSPSLRPHYPAPAVAVLLLAVSPFCYAFTRLAILEPLLILLTLLALLAASSAKPPTEQGTASFKRSLTPGPWTLIPALLGVLILLMVLTKTTAIFLLPSIAWMLFARAGYRLHPFLRLCLPAIAVAACLWLGYYGLIVRPHFLADYRYLFSANGYTGMTRDTAIDILIDTFRDGVWMGPILYPLSLLATATALLFSPRLLRQPLIPTLLLWVAGYTAFLAYHDNLQPRYYLVLAIPLTLLVTVVAEALLFPDSSASPESPPPTHPAMPAPLRYIASSVIVLALAAMAIADATHTLHFIRTPEYTFTTAAAQIRRVIAAEPTRNPLILSISGSNLSLMTGLPSICDDFGTMALPDRIRTYRPGWYLTWNAVDDDKMDALDHFYHLQRVAAFPAMDDPERNLLILYRLDPANPTPPSGRRRHPIPRRLQTRIGQQPSVQQLEH